MESNIVGAQLPTEVGEAKPMLDGIDDNYVVTIHNPLTQDFRVQYARTVAFAPSLTKDQQFAQEKGIDIRKDSNVVGHAVQYHILKAGKTENLPGDIAQIAVRQLVSHILMARAGKGNHKNVADPYARQEVEKTIVLAIKDRLEFMSNMNDVAPAQEIAELNPTTTEKPAEKDDAPNPPPGQGMNYEPKK